MSDFLYYCNKCNTLDTDFEKDQIFKCPGCGQNYYPLGITEDEWMEIDDNEKRKVMYQALTAKPSYSKNINAHTNNSSRNNMQYAGQNVDGDDDDDDMPIKFKRGPLILILAVVAVITAVIAALVL